MQIHPLRRPAPALSSSGKPRAEADPRGTKQSCSSTARPRATARRRTRRAARGSGLECELFRPDLVREQPTLHLDQVTLARVRKAADTVRRDDAMTRDHDGQAVVTTTLPDGP